jgi:hypothetical protein
MRAYSGSIIYVFSRLKKNSRVHLTNCVVLASNLIHILILNSVTA